MNLRIATFVVFGSAITVACKTDDAPVTTPDSGTAEVTEDAGSGSCPPCGSNAFCVKRDVLADASGPSFDCEPLPVACVEAPHVGFCLCAASLCPLGNRCTDLTPTLMECAHLAP